MLMNIIFWIIIILFTVTFHEVAHGFVAFLRGDDTAKRQGRLTLNPLKHIDPFWTIMFPIFLFVSTGGRFAIGMAKPVPVDFSRLKNPRQDMILVAVAGPFANFILASVLTLAFKLTGFTPLLYAVYFNLGLMVFNLIPIPPLDGSKVLAALLPLAAVRFYSQVERFGFLIILGLYFLGVLWKIVIPGINLLATLLDVPHLVLA